jgi:uracil-DNA glycosylase
MTLKDLLPKDWKKILALELEKDYFEKLNAFLLNEWSSEEIFPPKEDIFSALKHTPYNSVRVLILGQDPYLDLGQAHGLCFSVRRGVKLPPSLKNIYKELEADLGIKPADDGFLESWADQGVLLLNTVLTVRAHQANSHSKKGWEIFTDAIIKAVNEKKDPVVFVLWGNPSQKKIPLIDQNKHKIISSAHPSPLSARRGFFGSKPFSRINDALKKSGFPAIDWNLQPESDKPLQQELPLF